MEVVETKEDRKSLRCDELEGKVTVLIPLMKGNRKKSCKYTLSALFVSCLFYYLK